jgi:uncharacterized membrane protein YoaK (UPF0700 family)
MLQKYNTSRTPADNLRLGALTSFVAGMVNVSSVMIFFAFTSNITGHFAVLAEEISKGNWYQVGIVFGWIFLFFSGSFLANFLVIHIRRKFLAHSLPLLLEIVCLMAVGVYGDFWYSETLTETEVLLCFMLFAMGLQNGLTASISNAAVKTTHLTGLTTDLAILFSMFTQPEYRRNAELRGKARLLLTILLCYLTGGVIAGGVCLTLGFVVFYAVSSILFFIIVYDFYQLRSSIRNRRQYIRRKRSRSKTLVRQEEFTVN